MLSNLHFAKGHRHLSSLKLNKIKKCRQLDLIQILDRNYLESYATWDHEYISLTTCNQYSRSIKVRRYWNVDSQLAYVLGIWMGDKYTYGNRIGLSNKNENLRLKFEQFIKTILLSPFEFHHVVENREITKTYVNSALLLRIFRALEYNIEQIVKGRFVIPYISGKIDADGTILTSNLKHNSGLAKITYNHLAEAETDKNILTSMGYRCCITKYKNRNAFDLKLSILTCLKTFPLFLDFLMHEKKLEDVLFCLKATKTRKLVP